MRFRLRVRVSVVLFLFYFFLAQQPVGARSQTESDKARLLDALTPKISQSADQLIRSGEEVLRAADRISEQQTCAMGRELVGLGVALQKLSDALKMLEPGLLKKEAVDLSVLVNPDPTSPSGRAFSENARRTLAYRAALNKVAEAGRNLAQLDPAGTAGPPAEAAHLLRDAGQSLVDLDEISGIGLHVKHTGESMETLRLATVRDDKFTCAHAARLMGHMIGLAGENLAGSATSTLMQSSAALNLGHSLYKMSQQMPTPSLDEIDLALGLYERSLIHNAVSLSNRATIARAVNPPKEPAGLTDFFRAAASQFEAGASTSRSWAEHIDNARKALAGAKETRTSARSLQAAMQLAGAELREFGAFTSLIETGDALIRAGKLLEDHQSSAAAQVLSEAGFKIVAEEKPLVKQP